MYGVAKQVPKLTALAPESVQLEKLKLAAGDGTTQRIMPWLAISFACLTGQWVSPLMLTAWVVAVVAASLAYRRVQQRLGEEHEPANAKVWTARLALSTAALSATWASLGIFAWPAVDANGQLVLTIFVVGSMAGSAALTGACTQIFLTDFVIYMVALLLPRLIWWDEFSAWYMVIIPLFGGIMLSVGRITSRTASALLNLRDDKSQLIAQLEQAKAESDTARIRAEAANQAKSEFLANMSHELRTPLNAVIGFSEIMRDEILGPLTNRTYKAYAADIHMSGRLLLSLINDVLDLSKIEAGKLDLADDEVDLRALCEDMRRLLALKAEEAGVKLINDVPDGLIVIGDRRALKQVAVNLGSNALKFTPRGGFVRAYVGTEADGAMTLYVEDSGCGIAGADLERVFEVFGQGRHDVAAADKGTGLGLPIVRGLIRAHGGDVTIRSELGKGTTVVITMDPARVRFANRLAA